MDQQSSLARFIQYHTTNYDADVIHAASILWNSKTAGQMDEWIAFYNTAEAANTTANNHHTIALHRYEVVSNIVQNAVDHPLNADESNRLLGFVDLAIASFQDYQGSAAEAVQAWAQLQHAERTHPITGGLPDQAQGQINIQNEQMGHIPQAIQTFRQIRAYPPVRHDPAGHERIPEAWAEYDPNYESGKKARRVTAVHDTDLSNQTLNLPGVANAGWHHVPVAVANAESTYGNLWVCLDSKGRVKDRCFRKTVFWDEDRWRDPAYWEGDVRDPTRKIPNELACHYTMQSKAPGYIVNPRPYRYNPALVDNNTMSYKVYTEWCSHSNLGTLVNEHHQNHGPFFPEEFIWHTAEALIRAGLGMADISAVNDNVGQFEDGEIVHRDMKPENIFLGEAADGSIYPSIRLADFGTSMKTRPNDPNNPAWFVREGTIGYRSPEQRVWIDRRTFERVNQWPMGQHSNVFGIGLLLYSLIEMKGLSSDPSYIGLPPYHDYDLEPGHRGYSDRLLTMVSQCLRYDYRERPTFQDLLTQVQSHRASLDNEDLPPRNNPASASRTEGNRDGEAEVEEDEDEEYEDEEYEDEEDEDEEMEHEDKQDAGVEDNGLRLEIDQYWIGSFQNLS